MKFSSVPAAVLAIIAGGTIPAFAQAPPLTLTQPRTATRPPDPKAVPGFLDPATGKFTPLAPEAASPGKTVGGTFHYIPTFQFSQKFTLPNDSIFCTVTLVFGNKGGGGRFILANHFTEADFEFEAKNGFSIDVPIPYKYTPNSPNATFKVDVICFGFDDSGDEHLIVNSGSLQDLPNGAVNFHETISF